MRGRQAAIAVALLLAGAPAPGLKQRLGRSSRADVSGSLGWFNADKAELNSSEGTNDWYNRSLYGGAGFGWYWTDHWKTEIEGGASSEAELRTYTQTSSTAARPPSIPTYGSPRDGSRSASSISSIATSGFTRSSGADST